jgi:hypothetical protein
MKVDGADDPSRWRSRQLNLKALHRSITARHEHLQTLQ